MATRMLQRRGTAGEWATANPVLGDGELGFEKDTGILKIGDGSTAWQELEPAFEMPEVISVFGRTGNVTATSEDLTDGTSIGRAVFSAENEEAARAAIGAGTGEGSVLGEGIVKLKAISKADYDAIPVKDETVLYVIPVS